MNPKQAESCRRQRVASLPLSRDPEPEWHDRRFFLKMQVHPCGALEGVRLDIPPHFIER
jgi:hypothetical protein